jgi:hypothetical protein
LYHSSTPELDELEGLEFLYVYDEQWEEYKLKEEDKFKEYEKTRNEVVVDYKGVPMRMLLTDYHIPLHPRGRQMNLQLQSLFLHLLQMCKYTRLLVVFLSFLVVLLTLVIV